MLIIAGVFEVDPADRDAFITERRDLMLRSRAEPGCFAYAFTADPIEPGRVLLYERWESKDALAAHISVLRANPTSFATAVATSEVLQYEIANVGPVGS